jgi:hypothetical protein
LRRRNAITAAAMTATATPTPIPAMAACDRPDAAASGVAAAEVSLDTFVAVLEEEVREDDAVAYFFLFVSCCKSVSFSLTNSGRARRRFGG